MLIVSHVFGMFMSTVYPVAKARYFGYFSIFWYTDMVIKKQDMFKKLCGMVGMSLILVHLLVGLQ